MAQKDRFCSPMFCQSLAAPFSIESDSRCRRVRVWTDHTSMIGKWQCVASCSSSCYCVCVFCVCVFLRARVHAHPPGHTLLVLSTVFVALPLLLHLLPIASGQTHSSLQPITALMSGSAFPVSHTRLLPLRAEDRTHAAMAAADHPVYPHQRSTACIAAACAAGLIFSRTGCRCLVFVLYCTYQTRTTWAALTSRGRTYPWQLSA